MLNSKNKCKPKIDIKTTKAYLVGGGVASLSAAAFLIRDAKMPGENITIFEELKITGGSCDGIGEPDKGYVIRGGRMLNLPTYECTWDLFKSIPSLSNPQKSVTQEIKEFNDKIKTHSNARLVDKNRKIVDVSTMSFSNEDRSALLKLVATSEEELGSLQINQCFSKEFFNTNFWFMWATTFAFQPWHSAVELKRYMVRFMHEFPRINTLAGVARTPYNQYDSLILPLLKYLQANGVKFETNCKVVNLGFNPSKKENIVNSIHYIKDDKEGILNINENDIVFVTNGSMTEASSLGSMTEPPKTFSKKVGGSWDLWETIAKGRREFGNPQAFDDNIPESLWESFTVTIKNDPTFFKLEEEFTNNTPGTGALVTFKDSNWLMSIVVAYQPHFLNQPEDVQVFWGYGLFPDKEGNFIKKKMSDCTGEEILTELCYHFGFIDELPKILSSANCIPCMMPFITSQFMPRVKGDRPEVVPANTKNLAFIGQFCEIPQDVVFTVEYSIRSAQMAVYSLLNINKKIPKISKHQLELKVLLDSVITSIK